MEREQNGICSTVTSHPMTAIDVIQVYTKMKHDRGAKKKKKLQSHQVKIIPVKILEPEFPSFVREYVCVL